MYTEEVIDGFSKAAESLKKYRRAELLDEAGKSILDDMYVDLLRGDVVLKKCLLDNTTFLIGRKGTGKSTIFLKLENEYRKKATYLPCYIDVKTIFESSQAQVCNLGYLKDYMDEKTLEKYLMSRFFIQSVLEQIYTEIDKQRKSFFEKISDALSGNDNETIKFKIEELLNKVKENEQLGQIEVPVLQQHLTKIGNVCRDTEKEGLSNSIGVVGALTPNVRAGMEGNLEYENESSNSFESEFTSVFLKVFEIRNIIDELQKILQAIRISHLIIMLDDVSEIDGTALKMFMDTIVAPLNNWSNEFIKFKIAFYPNRVHYGNIDPGKIDIINLDFYNLYSEFDVNKMEENAVDFTKRLLNNRFEYFSQSLDQYIDDKVDIEEIYTLFFRVSMNVPRIMGYLLSYLHQSNVVYGKKITKQDIENAAEKYYDEKIDAFFRASTYCLLPLEEKRDIAQLKKMRDAVVLKSKEIKTQINRGELTGKYLKNMPYSSHFHIMQDMEKYLISLELNHFISKYEEMSNRDGRKVNIYCINYGLAKKNNILWGKPKGTEYRKYFIERPFNYTNVILEQIKEVQVIHCENPNCARVFSEGDLPGLQFTHFMCPDCHSKVIIERVIDDEVQNDIESIDSLLKLTQGEMDIVIDLSSRHRPVLARDIAGEVDMNSHRVAKLCKRLAENGIVTRRMTTNMIYEYTLSDYGKQYC